MNNNMGKSEIFVALYSHSDSKKYTVEEVMKEIQICSNMGASIFHFHISKLINGVQDYIDIINKLDYLKFEISLSDYNEIIKFKDRIKNLQRIMVSMHASSCKVFDKEFYYKFDEIVKKAKEYLVEGFLPEMSVFNEEGLENCIELNKMFEKEFMVGVYLDYPNGMKATKMNIERICNKLKDCRKISFAIYNNQKDYLIEDIIKNGANVRIGLEDNIYNGEKIAKNNAELIEKVLNIKQKSKKY